PHIASIRSTLGPARFTRQTTWIQRQNKQCCKARRPSLFLERCCPPASVAFKTSAADHYGIDWAPRLIQPDFATWDRVGGSITRPRIRVWVSQRAPSSQFTPLHWGRE